MPILACAALEENVGRILQAGADFSLSVSQVAGQLLVHHILGEMVSQQAHIKLVKRSASKLVGKNPMDPDIRERTGCTIVAVARANEVTMDLASTSVLGEDDELYVCGTVEALNSFNEVFVE